MQPEAKFLSSYEPVRPNLHKIRSHSYRERQGEREELLVPSMSKIQQGKFPEISRLENYPFSLDALPSGPLLPPLSENLYPTLVPTALPVQRHIPRALPGGGHTPTVLAAKALMGAVRPARVGD